MLTRAITPFFVISFAVFLLTLPSGTTGCIDSSDGGTASGTVVNPDAGEAGTTDTDAGSTLVYGCADNGTSCQCYSPAPAEYTQTSCIAYSCCYSDTFASNRRHGASMHVLERPHVRHD